MEINMSPVTAQFSHFSSRRRIRAAEVGASVAIATAGSLGLPTGGRSEASTARSRSAPPRVAGHPRTNGRAYVLQETMFRLESEGYVATACTREGTLMVNPKTHRRVTAKLV
jgi:hypothetical protein